MPELKACEARKWGLEEEAQTLKTYIIKCNVTNLREDETPQCRVDKVKALWEKKSTFFESDAAAPAHDEDEDEKTRRLKIDTTYLFYPKNHPHILMARDHPNFEVEETESIKSRCRKGTGTAEKRRSIWLHCYRKKDFPHMINATDEDWNAFLENSEMNAKSSV